MALLKEYLQARAEDAARQRHRVPRRRPLDGLDPSVQRELEGALDATAHGKGMVFNIALNYSGRTELADACGRSPPGARPGVAPEEIDEAAIEALPLHGRAARPRPPDPHQRRDADLELPALADRLRRDLRDPCSWPDFRARHFLEAIAEFQKRERRYGGVSENGALRDEVAAPAAHPAAASR